MKPYLIISLIFYLFTLVPWFLIWGLSFMSFDSGYNLYNVTFVLTISLYPVAIMICTILAWSFRFKKENFAKIINLVPLLWIIIFIGFMFFV